MTVLVYECFSGIAGNMNLGTLVAVGVPYSYLVDELKRLPIDENWMINCSRNDEGPIDGLKLSVIADKGTHKRGLSDISEMITAVNYQGTIEERALKMFEALADAEAKVHSISKDKVHFHEVGAIDAIIDIVGAAIALDYLSPSKVYCGPVEVGNGLVECDHGLLPVPAPATAELLKGIPMTRNHTIHSEATTPTGAAILVSNVDEFEFPQNFKAGAIGYGFGSKEFPIPNCVRVSLGEVSNVFNQEPNVQIECTIDDMPGEAFQVLFEQLTKSEILDVYLTPIVMKKSRPGHKLTVLVKKPDVESVIDKILTTTTTLGVRTQEVGKYMLPRVNKIVNTTLGEVNVKVAQLPDGSRRWKVEHDDVLSIVNLKGINYLQAKRQLDTEIRASSILDD